MYCVVEINGHQYKVKSLDHIDVELLPNEVGSELKFDKVYFVGGDDTTPKVGLPVVTDAKVVAEVVKHGVSRKDVVYKKKPGHRGVKKGHRQKYTELVIKSIEVK